MLYREIPSNKDKISLLGYGCMRLPQKAGLIDSKKAETQLKGAIDRGVNYVDTAMPYHNGQSEIFLGKTGLTGGYRDKIKLATKLPQYQVKSQKEMEATLDRQLKRLKTDRIDYYLLHTMDHTAWDRLLPLGIIDFLDKAKADGKIINAGFSYHGVTSGFPKLVDAYPWEFAQIQYNILDEYNQAGKAGLEYAASKGLGVIIMEPLRGGQLVKKVPKEALKIWDSLDEKKSPAEWALRWIWNHKEVTCVLSGMNVDEHIDENIRIASECTPNSLDKKTLNAVAEVKTVYDNLMKIGCTGCRYCLPCPAGIDIPFVFEHYNNLHMFDNKLETRFLYATRVGGLTSGSKTWASDCIKCGKCEKHCPQDLPIPDLMEKVSHKMEGPLMKATMAAGRVFLRKKPVKESRPAG
ncbi:MAG: aldo/keto reductase [Spirochaetales bacterium]|nr:aldo/keto reductase [Spirochaetales bacterium]